MIVIVRWDFELVNLKHYFKKESRDFLYCLVLFAITILYGFELIVVHVILRLLFSIDGRGFGQWLEYPLLLLMVLLCLLIPPATRGAQRKKRYVILTFVYLLFIIPFLFVSNAFFYTDFCFDD